MCNINFTIIKYLNISRTFRTKICRSRTIQFYNSLLSSTRKQNHTFWLICLFFEVLLLTYSYFKRQFVQFPFSICYFYDFSMTFYIYFCNILSIELSKFKYNGYSILPLFYVKSVSCILSALNLCSCFHFEISGCNCLHVKLF